MSVDAAGENAERGTPQTLGAALGAERERQGLSRADAAQRLHMSPSQVEALERGDYHSLPRGTFLRGFVRNYAKVLGLEPDSMLAMLAEAKPSDPAPRIVVPTQNIRFDPLGERFSSPYVKAATLAVVAVAMAFATMYWVMFVRPKPPGGAGHEPAPASSTAPVPALASPLPQAASSSGAEMAAQGGTPDEPQPAGAAPARMAAVPAPGKAAAKPAPPKDAPKPAPGKDATKDTAKDATKDAVKDAPPARVAAADGAAKPAKAGGRKTIHFHFGGDSWVEIRDAGGKVLYQKLNPAGSDADIAAHPPVDVIVGNAPEVRMSYDGADFPLEPHTQVAVARFTLE